jgi:phosphoenolpyruvate carboxylase
MCSKGVASILKVSGQKELMNNNKANRESIKLREHIMLPLVVMQQFALQRLRNNDDKKYTPQYEKIVLRCMFGIINAARNSA